MDASERPSPTDPVSRTKRTFAIVLILLILVALTGLVLTHLKKREPGSGMFGSVSTPPAVTGFG